LSNEIEEGGGLWALEGLNRSNNTRAFEAVIRWQD
jgi:hypothetical protein